MRQAALKPIVLIISQEYMTCGMRERAMELATEWLGPRTELEIQRMLAREVEQERWTSLDRTLQREAVDGLVKVKCLNDFTLQRQRLLLVGRLQRLQRMGLAMETQPGTWAAGRRGCGAEIPLAHRTPSPRDRRHLAGSAIDRRRQGAG